MAKCNRDCFNCVFDDCVVNDSDISSEERKAIRERDKIFTGYGSVFKARPKKAIHKRRYYN